MRRRAAGGHRHRGRPAAHQRLRLRADHPGERRRLCQITNRGTTPDTLLGASSPAAAGAMLHGGSMAHVMTLPIPAGGTLALAPGGTHIMLTDFVAMPQAGDSLTLILTFARAGRVTLQLPVRKYGDE
ncbi:MAG: copper chaperone PCu(A)C [Gemmatimonadetes bacterium]|nr:copper chaperone PCu(A)C [Gemmatimonadota bacterium]